jgi:hypothetical protein
VWSIECACTLLPFVAYAQRAPSVPDRPWESGRAENGLHAGPGNEMKLDPAHAYTLAELIDLAKQNNPGYDLTARSRIRSWQPLVRIIFMLRVAILRRGLIEDTGVYDPRVAEAIAVSSRVFQEIRGMTIVECRADSSSRSQRTPYC